MKSKTYYSIRVIKARTKKEAISKILTENFEEQHVLCDAVVTEKTLKRLLK